jgi:hypothetical protein
LSRKKGTQLAEAIVKDLTDEDKRRTWIEQRCIELLRGRIAIVHPQLTDLARETTSRRIKSAIVSKIYSAIAAGYPQLADAAADVCARKQLAIPPESSAQKSQGGVQVDLDIEETIPGEEIPDAAKAQSAMEAESIEPRVRQVTHLALLCLKDVKEYLVPEAAKEDIGIDSASVHAWAMTIFLALTRSK